jgi:hypothetical protein
LANDATVVAWNTDKQYLRELGAAGVPMVDTSWVAPGDSWAAPSAGEWVVKPAVSAGSVDTGRYDLAAAEQRSLAVAQVRRLQAAGRLVMVQPYLDAVDSAGETALLHVDGAYSHAIRKGPMLTGPDAGVEGLYKAEHIQPREPTEAEYAVASAVLSFVAERFGMPLYARVDLIPDAYGQPRLIELELTEPSLFLGYAPGAADRLAAAIAARASR